jgi:hypothetical protein
MVFNTPPNPNPFPWRGEGGGQRWRKSSRSLRCCGRLGPQLRSFAQYQSPYRRAETSSAPFCKQPKPLTEYGWDFKLSRLPRHFIHSMDLHPQSISSKVCYTIPLFSFQCASSDSRLRSLTARICESRAPSPTTASSPIRRHSRWSPASLRTQQQAIKNHAIVRWPNQGKRRRPGDGSRELTLLPLRRIGSAHPHSVTLQRGGLARQTALRRCRQGILYTRRLGKVNTLQDFFGKNIKVCRSTPQPEPGARSSIR